MSKLFIFILAFLLKRQQLIFRTKGEGPTGGIAILSYLPWRVPGKKTITIAVGYMVSQPGLVRHEGQPRDRRGGPEEVFLQPPGRAPAADPPRQHLRAPGGSGNPMILTPTLCH